MNEKFSKTLEPLVQNVKTIEAVEKVAVEVWILQVTEFVGAWTMARASRPDLFSDFLTPDEWCKQFRIYQGGE